MAGRVRRLLWLWGARRAWQAETQAAVRGALQRAERVLGAPVECERYEGATRSLARQVVAQVTKEARSCCPG